MEQSINSDEDTLQEQRIERASRAALAGLLNLTFLPIIGFIWLIFISRSVDLNEIDHYHVRLAIKMNIFAAIALLLLSNVVLVLGGFDSLYTWVYVITYFTLVHSLFILGATWAMVVAWSGEKLTKLQL